MLGGRGRAEGLAVQSRDEGRAEGMCPYSSIEGCVEMVLLRGMVCAGGGNFLGEVKWAGCCLSALSRVSGRPTFRQSFSREWYREIAGTSSVVSKQR